MATKSDLEKTISALQSELAAAKLDIQARDAYISECGLHPLTSTSLRGRKTNLQHLAARLEGAKVQQEKRRIEREQNVRLMVEALYESLAGTRFSGRLKLAKASVRQSAIELFSERYGYEPSEKVVTEAVKRLITEEASAP